MNKNVSHAIKAILLIVCFSFFQNDSIAQTFDNGIFFQALARDNYSNPAKDRKIYVQSTIIQSTITGTKVLVEEFQSTTDPTGVFGISIGKGIRTGGSLAGINNIDWSAGPYFLNLKISITPVAPLESWNYAKDWVDLGTTSFGSVPYAYFAKNVAGFETKLNVSDTAKMLLQFAKSQALTLVQNAVNTKLNTADSIVKYVTPTQLANNKFDTTALSNRINLKANASNVISNTNDIAANTAALNALSTVAKTGDYNDLSNKPTLSLPAATANTLGGVIVGNNLTIDQNGVLSASSSNNANSLSGVVPVANGGTGNNSVNGIKSIVGLLGNTVAIGDQAGTFNQNSNTVAIGGGAGNTNQGQSAIGIGYVAGNQNQGANSIAIGSNAAQGNQGQQAIAVGFAAGQNGQGDYAVALGSFAGNVQAANSIALNATGNSLNPASSGFYVAPIRNIINANSLFYNPTTNEITYGTGVSSSGVPYTGATGAVNLGAYDLTVNGLTIGTGAGTSTSTSLYNTAVGYNSLVTNTTGAYNTGVGRGTLRYNTTGNYNSAFGVQSLNYNTTGVENTSIGMTSSFSNQTGSYNTTIGTRSMFNNVYANNNTAIGWNAGTFTGQGGTSSSSGGNNNTSLGYRALYANTLGNDNTAVGFNALQANATGTQNTTIGSGADVATNALSNATAIGYGAIATASNTMQLGNTNVTLVKTSGTLITPKMGVGTSTPVSAAAVEINSTTQGFLPPRMRAGQRDSIAAPVQGLVVYCTNCGSSGELEVYNGSAWVNLMGSAAQAVPAAQGTNLYSYSYTSNLVGGSYVYSTYKFDGTSWTYVAASPISNNIGNYVGQIGSNHYSLLYNGSSYSMYAFNGTTWSPVSTSGTAPSSVYAGYMGLFNNKLYHYLYNGTGYSTYSFDGTTWQTVNTAGTPPTNGLYGGYLGSFNNISYFYAYNGSSYSLYSFNGTTWNTISNSSTNSYTFLGQIGNTSYLSYYNGSGYSYSTFNGTSFASWNPTGLPSGLSGYNFNYMGVINNKLYTAISDNSTGLKTMYSFDGNSFTNLSSITNPGTSFGGFNCYMCSTYFIGGNLK